MKINIKRYGDNNNIRKARQKYQSTYLNIDYIFLFLPKNVTLLIKNITIGLISLFK